MISLFGDDASLDLTGMVTAMPRSSTWRHASVDPIGGPSSRQAMGRGAPSMTLSLSLHRERNPVTAILEQLEAWAEAYEVVVVQVIESGDVIGAYTIDRIDTRPVWAMPTGEVVSQVVEISLVAPGREVERSSAEAVEGADTERLELEPAPEDRSEAPDDVTTRSIARR